MSIKAMKQALEALEYCTTSALENYPIDENEEQKMESAITAIKAAIEEAEKQEPVAWISKDELKRCLDGYYEAYCHGKQSEIHSIPLYTTPPARGWVGLTDEEIRDSWDKHIVPVFGKNGINPIVFARAIEAKLKEKNYASEGHDE